MDIGRRLRQERQRLGLTQSDFAAVGGVAANALLKYEQGIRFPRADFLSALDMIGVDVLFVVTGARMPILPGQSERLLDAEKTLIAYLRVLHPHDLNLIARMTFRLAEYTRRAWSLDSPAY